MIKLTDKYWAVEVPSMAFGLMVNNYATESELIYMLSMSDIADDDNSEETLIAKPLPPGTCRFLFTTKTATEEDARKVVEPVNNPFLKGGNRYRDYTVPQSHTIADAVCNAVQSLHSLLRSEGLDPNKNNYALIEKMSSDE